MLAFLPLLLALQALCEEAVQRTAQAAARRGGWSQSTAGGGTAHSKTQAARLRATDLFPHSPLSVDTSCCARVAGAPLQTETRKRRSPTRIIARRARDDRTPRGGARARGGGRSGHLLASLCRDSPSCSRTSPGAPCTLPIPRSCVGRPHMKLDDQKFPFLSGTTQEQRNLSFSLTTEPFFFLTSRSSWLDWPTHPPVEERPWAVG